ncbi:hypothetical protein AVEN_245279-1 [Araneus ventricosus]|uniref:Uncharacterized protein n=1 Tax=Araneus ventricosus TaxID=182803 RepID=A0A4Y2VDQ6_ARAVE|nr:hypothetical protein AVEN_245279-1 [Araneus ventricosus]
MARCDAEDLQAAAALRMSEFFALFTQEAPEKAIEQMFIYLLVGLPLLRERDAKIFLTGASHGLLPPCLVHMALVGLPALLTLQADDTTCIVFSKRQPLSL